ncbi:hypothetical protein Mal4_28920 [Maioricimonas rarisocia]|uniref:Cytochrome c domain-containing protein n=1 Tax=Maioricimonas rarisocia TaxID=2528026 RepID=A0A517Z7U9_9PLAN|nr:hypothetical protein [Maioricimonas rarisocia]QDU38563.1 hypothetical protein Mal4_28920 [Maioricimonas rarisocia]
MPLLSRAGTFTAVMLALTLIPCALPASETSQLFEQRILPIAKAKSGSSCTECHFSGVELSDYVRESEAETFAALRNAGLIDVEQPDQSKILEFIARKPDKPNPLIEKVRQRELTAFRDWIKASAGNAELLQAKTTERIGTELPPEVIRHARRDRVLGSFVDNIWSEMARCVSCHSPEKNRRLIERHGEDAVDAISWVVPHDPAATLQRLVDDANIDLDAPEMSPLLRKPAGLDEHGGGPKFVVGGPTWDNYLTFLRDYAAIRSGKYRSAQDLPPAPDALVLPTHQHLRMTDIPERLTDSILKVDLYRWREDARSWSKQPVGTAVNRVAKKRLMWQSVVSAVVPTDSPHLSAQRRDPHLPGGRYRAVISTVPVSELSPETPPDWQEEATLEFHGKWPAGYQPPKVVHFPAETD